MSTTTTDLSPLIKVNSDGTVHRLIGSPHVPPSPEDPTAAVASIDITIPLSISARLYLPKLAAATHPKLPILLYFHGGGFCLESAFSVPHHRYTNLLSAKSGALILSVEYRLAPENPLRPAYDDSASASALKWVCSHAIDQPGFRKEQWVYNHGDFCRIFIGGDGFGANIAHNLAVLVGSDPLPGDVKIAGVILSHPYLCGSNGGETKEDLERSFAYRMWSFVYPTAAGGIDNPVINPLASGALSLSGLGCSKMIIFLAEKDPTAARGKLYAEMVRQSGWEGELEVVEFEGENHCFQITDNETENAKILINRFVAFLSR